MARKNGCSRLARSCRQGITQVPFRWHKSDVRIHTFCSPLALCDADLRDPPAGDHTSGQLWPAMVISISNWGMRGFDHKQFQKSINQYTSYIPSYYCILFPISSLGLAPSRNETPHWNKKKQQDAPVFQLLNLEISSDQILSLSKSGQGYV